MGYPGLEPDRQGELVQGYLFSSDQLGAAWEGLDEFEGCDYKRMLIPVVLGDGEEIMAYVYAVANIRLKS